MDAEEARQIAERLERYEAAENDILRYGKLKAVLDAIPGGDHGIAAIIIDVQKREFHYLPAIQGADIGLRFRPSRSIISNCTTTRYRNRLDR